MQCLVAAVLAAIVRPQLVLQTPMLSCGGSSCLGRCSWLYVFFNTLLSPPFLAGSIYQMPSTRLRLGVSGSAASPR